MHSAILIIFKLLILDPYRRFHVGFEGEPIYKSSDHFDVQGDLITHITTKAHIVLSWFKQHFDQQKLGNQHHACQKNLFVSTHLILSKVHTVRFISEAI